MKRLSPEEAREERRKAQAERRSPAPVSEAARKIRKAKAIEAHLTRYLHLACGHYGTRDAILAPRNGLFWCDVEGIFSEVIPRIYKRELPEEPEF